MDKNYEYRDNQETTRGIFKLKKKTKKTKQPQNYPKPTIKQKTPKQDS